MKQALLVCLLGGTLAISNGCCGWQAGACGPCGPCMAPDCGSCDGPCEGPGCGLLGWRRGPVTYEPDGGFEGAPCGDCGSCGSCRPWGPFFWFPGLFGRHCNGCGERYWGVYSDPVDCCDPCDRCGNWSGPAGCGCGGPSGMVSGPVYDGNEYANASPMPSAQVPVAASPRPQYAPRPQPQQYSSRPQYATRTPTYAARPQYPQRARQYSTQPQYAAQRSTGQPHYAAQPKNAPRVISEADQVFDPTITDPVWQTTQQPRRAISQ